MIKVDLSIAPSLGISFLWSALIQDGVTVGGGVLGQFVTAESMSLCARKHGRPAKPRAELLSTESGGRRTGSRCIQRAREAWVDSPRGIRAKINDSLPTRDPPPSFPSVAGLPVHSRVRNFREGNSRGNFPGNPAEDCEWVSRLLRQTIRYGNWAPTRVGTAL